MRAHTFVSKILFLTLSVSGLSCVLAAMQGGAPQGNLVLVPVSVTDAKNIPVTTLKQDSFQLLEDNKEQKIVQFSSATDPLTLGVVLGLSAQGPIKTPGQKDRASVEVLDAVTRIREANPAGPLVQNPFDGDGMFETVVKSMNELSKVPNPKKAIVVVSDGYIASGSQASSVPVPKSLIDNSKLAQFPIYFLFASSTTNSLPGFTENSSQATGYYLQQVAEYSGGNAIAGQTENNLAKVSTDLRDSLKTLYFLGFQSTNTAKDGKWRKLTVKVTPPADIAKVKVDAKPRYFVPKG
jgi:Ca-activated chloride channel homolog